LYYIILMPFYTETGLLFISIDYFTC
jgi:hypothetical protein